VDYQPAVLNGIIFKVIVEKNENVVAIDVCCVKLINAKKNILAGHTNILQIFERM